MPRETHGTAKEWMDRARGKLLLAKQPLPDGGYWEDLCFMTQQAVELAVKAVYQAKGFKFAYVHDLGFLLDELEKKGVFIPDAVRESEILTVYATQMRYPGMTGFICKDTYDKAIFTASLVLEWAEGLLAE